MRRGSLPVRLIDGLSNSRIHRVVMLSMYIRPTTPYCTPPDILYCSNEMCVRLRYRRKRAKTDVHECFDITKNTYRIHERLKTGKYHNTICTASYPPPSSTYSNNSSDTDFNYLKLVLLRT